MKIVKVHCHHLENIPVQPPPFREVPNTTPAFMIEVETDTGVTGWSRAGYAHPIIVDFINNHLGPEIIGEDPLFISRMKARLDPRYAVFKALDGVYRCAWSNIDIALWDIKAKSFGVPLHHLLGGAADKIPVYVTFGVPYGDDPRFSIQELVDEAKYWVAQGQTRLKTVVGRQVIGHKAVPNAREDYQRLAAVRAAVGPDVHLAMDGAFGMSLPEAIRLCHMCEELDIAFLEEPLYENDPVLLAQLRRHTSIPIAAAENHKYSARHLLSNKAVDIIQPNVNNDGGYTGGIAIAAIAKQFNTPIGHGNGAGPHNIALQAGVENGTEVEYHLLRWMAYNAIFEDVPQPKDSYLAVSQAPGSGLVPKDGLINEFAVQS
jgi:L-alanine-DL-glutamate epimerase-like enolase superfamily enzyme